MKLNGLEVGVQGRRDPIYCGWAAEKTMNNYQKRRSPIVMQTKELAKYKHPWLTDLRVIEFCYDKLIEYRVVTGVDKDEKEFETRWYGEWKKAKKGEKYVYDPTDLDNAKWIEVPTVSIYR